MKNLSSTYSAFNLHLTSSRLKPYQLTFDVTNDHELMGAYLWSQQVAGTLYPLFHFIEIFVRNAVDKAAKKRFGDYWWNTFEYDRTDKTCKKFIKNIQDAERNLKISWENAERARLGISYSMPIPTNCPTFSHDQIIAATEFSTGTFILTNGFFKPSKSTSKNYLWPSSLGNVFPQYNKLSTKPVDALKSLHDHLTDIRKYRNRVFHHEPIWIKGNTQRLTSIRAIQTIRQKITKIENFIELLGKRLHREFIETNLINNAKRVCSLKDLYIYQGKAKYVSFTTKQKRLLRKKLSAAQQETICISYNEKVFGLSHII
ncbi:hypothetical protein ACOCIL_04915 [Acinetobacter baumannii]|uniref:hypothetical protein n=1 Tax=Acinetobacter baumannii TaxID=470 RepID=UPI003B42CB14